MRTALLFAAAAAIAGTAHPARAVVEISNSVMYAGEDCTGEPVIVWNVVPSGVCTNSGGVGGKMTCGLYQMWSQSTTCEGEPTMTQNYTGQCFSVGDGEYSAAYECAELVDPVQLVFKKAVCEAGGEDEEEIDVAGGDLQIVLDVDVCTPMTSHRDDMNMTMSALAVRSGSGFVVTYFADSTTCAGGSGNIFPQAEYDTCAALSISAHWKGVRLHQIANNETFTARPTTSSPVPSRTAVEISNTVLYAGAHCTGEPVVVWNMAPSAACSNFGGVGGKMSCGLYQMWENSTTCEGAPTLTQNYAGQCFAVGDGEYSAAYECANLVDPVTVIFKKAGCEAGDEVYDMAGGDIQIVLEVDTCTPMISRENEKNMTMSALAVRAGNGFVVTYFTDSTTCAAGNGNIFPQAEYDTCVALNNGVHWKGARLHEIDHDETSTAPPTTSSTVPPRGAVQISNSVMYAGADCTGEPVIVWNLTPSDACTNYSGMGGKMKCGLYQVWENSTTCEGEPTLSQDYAGQCFNAGNYSHAYECAELVDPVQLVFKKAGCEAGDEEYDTLGGDVQIVLAVDVCTPMVSHAYDRDMTMSALAVRAGSGFIVTYFTNSTTCAEANANTFTQGEYDTCVALSTGAHWKGVKLHEIDHDETITARPTTTAQPSMRESKPSAGVTLTGNALLLLVASGAAALMA